MDSDSEPTRLAPLIFVFEDDTSQRELVVDYLLAHYRINGYSSTEEFTAAIAGEQPHLIMLDLMIQDQPMYALCAKLKRQGNSAKIMFITGRDSAEDRRAGYASGCDDFLSKPYSLVEMRLRVEIWVTVRAIEIRLLDAATFGGMQPLREELNALVASFKEFNMQYQPSDQSVKKCEQFLSTLAAL